MKTLTKVDAIKLATGIQQILLDMAKAGIEPSYPIDNFEHNIVERKQVTRKEAGRVTELVINTGIIRWDLGSNAFVL